MSSPSVSQCPENIGARLLDRTVERDNGFQEWERLELYLEENPPRVSCARGMSAARENKLDILEDALTSLVGSTELGSGKRAYLWTKACDEFDSQIAVGAKPNRTKRLILNALQKSGFVGSALGSLRKTFSRKWTAYLKNDAGLLIDRRSLRYAKAMPGDIPEEDRLKMVARSIDCGGRVAQGIRELFQNGELSSEVTERFIANPSRKSYVPATIRKIVAPEVKRLMPLHHGPREHELRGAFNRRDYSMMFAGDSYQADDCTCPVVYWEHDSASRWGYRIIRGQLLLMIDERSLLGLGFALHSENNYNARIIRALITRVHDGFGLPRRRFYFERGLWRESRILTGEKRFSDELSLDHTEIGLRGFGVAFCHARLPRGKVIERIFGLIQNRMERLPGYVGRDERHDRFERVQKQINEARNNHAHPKEFFLNKEQWESELTGLLDAYNSERQEGAHLKGLSPLQAWNNYQATEGQVHLGERARYLLAHHKQKLRVRRDGITLRPSLGGGTYCGDATGKFLHEDVWVWFNPEEPEYIALTSLDGKRGPFVVPRLDPLPAIDASREQLNRNADQIAAHNNEAKTSYRLISPHLAIHNFRREVLDVHTVDAGKQLTTGVAAVRAEKSRVRASFRKVTRLARELNIDPREALAVGTVEPIAEGLTEIKEALRLNAEQTEVEL